MKSRIKFKSFSTRAKRLVYSTALFFVIDFATSIIVSQCLGGDALNGYIHAGNYFVCAHGSCSPVSPAIWRLSYWQQITVLFGIALLLVELVVFVNTGDIPIDWDAT